MAKKSLNPLEDPPTASSSEDEEVESSAGEEDEEEVSSSEEEEAPVKSAVTVASSGKPSASAVKQVVSDSESGSETETDSDSEPERPPPNPVSGKSIVPAPVSTASKAKKEAHASATLALPAVKSGKKRPSEGTSRETNAKRIKNGDGGEDTKKPAFQRLWTEEDEIAVLQGMIDFKNDTGKSPYEDTNVFYDFIKESISFEVSKNQFMDKIRSLKKKYMGKEKNGAEKSFSKAHDQKSLALSKFIWGPGGMGLESAVKSNANGVSKKSRSKTKKTDTVKQELFASPNGKQIEEDTVTVVEVPKTSDWFENSFIAHSLAGLGVHEEYVKQNWRLVSSENKKRVQDVVKDLQAREIGFVMEKTKFLHEVATMIAEASKN